MRDGVAYVANRGQTPIVPVGIGGSERVMPAKAKYLRPVKMVLVVGSFGARALPASCGRPSRSGQSRVPSLTNFHPVGLVLSGSGRYTLKARTTPSNPGSANPAVTIMLLRCGTG